MNKEKMDEAGARAARLAIKSLSDDGLSGAELVCTMHILGTVLIGCARAINPQYADLDLDRVLANASADAFVYFQKKGLVK